METRRLRPGLQVRIRPAGGRRHPLRTATVRALILRGPRRNRAVVEYADTGASAEVPVQRIVAAP